MLSQKNTLHKHEAKHSMRKYIIPVYLSYGSLKLPHSWRQLFWVRKTAKHTLVPNKLGFRQDKRWKNITKILLENLLLHTYGHRGHFTVTIYVCSNYPHTTGMQIIHTPIKISIQFTFCYKFTVTIHRLKWVNVPFAPAAVPLPLYSQQRVASGWLPSPLCQQATLTDPPVLPGTFLTAGDQHQVCDLVHSATNKWKLKIIITCNDTHNWLYNRCIMKKVMGNTKDTLPHTIT